jgi:hypothetical protein
MLARRGQGAVILLDAIDVENQARRRRALVSKVLGDFWGHRSEPLWLNVRLLKATDVIAKRSNEPATLASPIDRAGKAIARTLDVVA